MKTPEPFRPDDPQLHAVLRALKPPAAPSTLVPGVLAAIRAQALRPWWQRPLLQWPSRWRFLALAALAGLTGSILYGSGSVGEGLAASQAGSVLETLSSVGSAGSRFALRGLQSIPTFWMWIMGSVAVLAYAGLLGVGTLLYRVTHPALKPQ